MADRMDLSSMMNEINSIMSILNQKTDIEARVEELLEEGKQMMEALAEIDDSGNGELKKLKAEVKENEAYIKVMAYCEKVRNVLLANNGELISRLLNTPGNNHEDMSAEQGPSSSTLPSTQPNAKRRHSGF